MIVSRETIYAATFARIAALKGTVIQDCSRKLIHWEDLQPSQMPFVCQVQMPERGDYKLMQGVPTKWNGRISYVIYVSSAGDSDLVPSTAMNNVVDAIEAAFSPFKSNGQRNTDEQQGRCTLGGLVHDIRVFGEVELDDGSLGTQSVAIVPVEFIV